MSGPRVYAMVTAPTAGRRYVKFGVSKRLAARARDVQSMCPIPIEYMYSVRCETDEEMMRFEAALHAEHAARSIVGEWFSFKNSKSVIADIRLALRCIGERELGVAKVESHVPPALQKSKRDFNKRYARRALKAFVTVGDESLDGVEVRSKSRLTTRGDGGNVKIE